MLANFLGVFLSMECFVGLPTKEEGVEENGDLIYLHSSEYRPDIKMCMSMSRLQIFRICSKACNVRWDIDHGRKNQQPGKISYKILSNQYHIPFDELGKLAWKLVITLPYKRTGRQGYSFKGSVPS